MRTALNLLPMPLRREQLARRRIVQWTKILAACMALGAIAHWYVLAEQEVLAQRLEVLSREHHPTRTMLKQLIDMREQLVQLQIQEVVARELEYQRHVLALLGVISQTAQKTAGRLRVTEVALTDFQSTLAAGTLGPGKPQAGSCLIGGMSLDNPSVAELLDSLQDSGLFSRVELVSLKEREGSETAMRDYKVRCEL
jgi:Fimbrial assembly protein (PilN)